MSRNRIYKFDLEPGANDFHGIVRVLGVGRQTTTRESLHGTIHGAALRVWAEVDPDDRTTITTLYAAMTGQEPPPLPNTFIGTAVGPTYVIHVYLVS